jgi:hypothetical protein
MRPNAHPGCAQGSRRPRDVPRGWPEQVPPERCWQEADGLHVDGRGLPPPQPLLAILALVGAGGGRQARDAPCVIVHHHRDPVMLYPELAELGWRGERIDAPPGEVRLRLSPAA